MTDPIHSTLQMRLLVVDDDANGRRAMKFSLRKEQDIDVVGEAGDGQEAVAEARRLRPDVVLMDIDMPVLDGIEACRRIHDEMPEVRVIAVTGETDDASRRNMLNAGAEDFVLKGRGLAPLLEAVRRI